MINLVPDDTRQELRYGRHNLIILRYFLALLIIAAAIAATFMVGILALNRESDRINSKLEQQNAQLTAYSEVLSEAKSLSDTIKTIEALLNREVKFSQLLTDIAALVPAGASLDGISLSSEEDTLNLTATIATQELAAVFQKNLASSELFAVADISAINKTTTSTGVGAYSVTLTVIFAPDEAPLANDDSTSDAEGGQE
jgi:Tfp pilus assembly protein PilN